VKHNRIAMADLFGYYAPAIGVRWPCMDLLVRVERQQRLGKLF